MLQEVCTKCVPYISKTDVIQFTLTLKMTTAQAVETSVTVNNNSPIQDYVQPDNQTQPTFAGSYNNNYLLCTLKFYSTTKMLLLPVTIQFLRILRFPSFFSNPVVNWNIVF